MRAFEHVARALLPDEIIRPVIILLGIGGLYFFAPHFLSSRTTMVISVLAAGAAVLVSAFWLSRMWPPQVSQQPAILHSREWLFTGVPLMFTLVLNLVLSQTSPILLGFLSDAKSLGLFAAAFRVAYLLTFFQAAVNFIISPIIARLYANGEKERLQHLLTSSVRITFLAGLVTALLFIFGNQFILSVFGKEFLPARVALIIMTLGYLCDIALGSTMTLMTMTGFQKALANILGIFTIINIALNLLLIPVWNFTGAAIASTSTLILSRLVLMIYMRKKVGVNPAIL
jgi:O-antigen/teichoic acid export membrane protein